MPTIVKLCWKMPSGLGSWLGEEEDSCPAHPKVIDLKSVTLALIPPTISVPQLINQGIDAILMVNNAWNIMSQSTIQNCFKNARFIENYDSLPIQIAEFNDW